jgi:hypothetical protein
MERLKALRPWAVAALIAAIVIWVPVAAYHLGMLRISGDLALGLQTVATLLTAVGGLLGLAARSTAIR